MDGNKIKKFILKSIEHKIECEDGDDGVTVYIPILDGDMHYIGLHFSEEEDGSIVISDKGDILGNLYIAGKNPYDEESELYRKIKCICEIYTENMPYGDLKELKIELPNGLNTDNKESMEKFVDYLNALINIRSM